MSKKIHIICFDVPSPPNYGGVMDVFYKIKNLAKNGAEIYLHVFKYGRKEQSDLKDYCKEVHYYERNTSFLYGLTHIPYIVRSRNNALLIKNLERIKAPILFEGLHTTLVIRKGLFKDRNLLVRTHNVEHQYYNELARHESNIAKKFYYWIESVRLKNYEKVLKQCQHILSVSKLDTDYFKKKYGDKVVYLPPFHPNKALHELSKKGYFALFHGNLKVADNMKAAHLLIDVFKSLQYPLVIAGKTSDKKLMAKIDSYKNISFIAIEDQNQLVELFHRAHVNVLFSNNASGIKLKLINAVFQSRFIIANSKTSNGSGLESLCIEANSKQEITDRVLKIMDKDFSVEEIELRKNLLSVYDNQINAQIILNLL